MDRTSQHFKGLFSGGNLHPRRRRRSMDITPPSFRIVLLGDWVKKNEVGNFLLGKNVFETKRPSSPAVNHSTGFTGYVLDRLITVASTADLFTPDITECDLTLKVRKCVLFCTPGPHALVLVINPSEFDEKKRQRMEDIVNAFSDKAFQHSIVFIYKGQKSCKGEAKKIVDLCGRRTYLYNKRQNQEDALKTIKNMISGNGGSFVSCDRYEDAEEVTEISEPSRQEAGHGGTLSITSSTNVGVASSGRLNLVLCGSSEEATAAVADLILSRGGQKQPAPYPQPSSAWVERDASAQNPQPGSACVKRDASAQSPQPSSACVKRDACAQNPQPSSACVKRDASAQNPQPSSVCVKRDAEVCGRHVTLVLLPSFGKTQLSEKALLQETQKCLSLCDPGVHAFILVIPERPLTDEDKGEYRRIKQFFGEQVDTYHQTVLTSESKQCVEGGDAGAVAQDRNEISGDSYYVLDDNSKVLPLLKRVEKMGGCYTSDMYITAQLEMYLKCHSQHEDMKTEVQKLKSEIRTLKGSSQVNTDDLRIVLLGKTGTGKSATGNTIVGREVFEEILSSKSVTVKCMKDTAMINGRRITVVDTPGLFDTACDNNETKKEIIRCVAMAAPGPHVFLLVIALGRFTNEERETVKMLKEMFGEESEKYTIVLFTRGDDLQGQTLDGYLKDADPGITTLLRQCGNRRHLFNNRVKTQRDQVSKLLDKIDSLVMANGGEHYTTEMFQRAEEALKQEQDRILKEREEQIKKEKEDLQAKHEAEMEKLKREMEEERRRQEEERRRREEEFKFREQDMKEKMKTLEEEERCKRKAMEEDYKVKEKQNEDWIKQRTEEIQQERQRQQEEWHRKTQAEQKRREEEEEERKIKLKEYERSWHERQRREKEKFNLEKETMMKSAEEEKREKQQEYEERVRKEEEKRKDLEEKIKHAEESRVNDLEEQKQRHEEECQRKSKEEEKRREEEENKWKKQMESMEREWSAKQEQQRREKEKYEMEQQKEKEKRDAEVRQRKMEEENERRRIEQDAERKIKEKEYELIKLQQDNKSLMKKSREREEQQRAEMEEQLRMQRHKLEEEKQKEAKASEEKERRNVEYLKDVHEKEKDRLKRETEMAARKQAEEEFNKKLDSKVKEAKTQGHDEGYKVGKEVGERKGHKKGYKEGHEKGKEEVEAERSAVGKFIDRLLK